MAERTEISPFDRSDERHLITLRGSLSFAEALKVSANSSDAEATIEFLSATDAAMVVNGETFLVKLTKHERAEVFRKEQNGLSFDYLGDASSRAVITTKSAKDLHALSKTYVETKPSIEVMSMDQIMRPSLQGEPDKKKPRSEPAARSVLRTSAPTKTSFSSSSSASLSKPPARLEPVQKALTTFVCVKNLPIEVSLSDFRSLFSGLSMSRFFISLMPNSTSFDAFVQFESQGGADLAMMRHGETARVRRSHVQSSESSMIQIAMHVRPVSILESIWVTYSCFRFELTQKISTSVFSEQLVKEMAAVAMGDGDGDGDGGLTVLSGLLTEWTATACCAEWHALFDKMSVFEPAITETDYAERLLAALSARETTRTDKVINDSLRWIPPNASEHLESQLCNEYKIQSNGILRKLATSLQLLQSIDPTDKWSLATEVDITRQALLDWKHRLRHLLRGLTLMHWKQYINLYISME